MSYAPYYNTPAMTQPALSGIIHHAETRVFFEYSARPDGDRPGLSVVDFPSRVFTCDGDRAARILKTVAYVVIDEDADGEPIVEKWPLASNRAYAAI